MKKHSKRILFVVLYLFAGILTLPIHGEVCLAQEFDAALNVMGYDRDVTIKINDVHLTRITGGMSQSTRLFLTDDPRLKDFPSEMQTEMKQLFCLKPGENTIEISFKEKAQTQAFNPITITIDSSNYQVPVLKFAKNPDIKEGSAKGTFTIFADEPAGFTTIVLE